MVLWETATGEPLWAFGRHAAEVKALTFSRDGRFVLTGAGGINVDDNTARLLDGATGRELRSFRHASPVMAVALSPDGRVALTVCADRTAYLWNTDDGKELRRFRSYTDNLMTGAFTPDGREVALATGSAVNFYHTASGKPVRNLEGAAFETSAAAFAPRGRFIATGNSYVRKQENSITAGVVACLWDTAAGGESGRLEVKDYGILALAYSADGRRLLVGTGSTAVLWDAEAEREVARFKEEAESALTMAGIFAVASSADGRLALTGHSSPVVGGRNYVVLWSAETGRELRRWQMTGETISVSFARSDSLVLTGSGDAVFDPKSVGLVEQERAVIAWDAASGREVKRLPGHRLAVSLDGRYVAVAGASDEDRAVRLYDVTEDFKELRALGGLTRGVEALAFSPDGTYVVAGGNDGKALLWEAGTGKQLAVYDAGVVGLRSVSVAQDNRFVLTLSEDGLTRVWERATGVEVCRVVSFPDGAWVAVSPDGRFDTNNLEAIRGLHWIVPDDPLRPLPLEIFMRQYYEPRLLARLLNGERLKPVPALASLNRSQPRVSITDVSLDPHDGERARVTVEVASVRDAPRDGSGQASPESGVNDVRLFRDGQLVGYAPENGGAVALGPEGKAVHTFDVRLPRGKDVSQVEFSAHAFNRDRVKSATALWQWPEQLRAQLPKARDVRRRAYVVSVGVNASRVTRWRLRFAAPDAREMQRVLTENLRRAGEYEVVAVPLISEDEVRGGGGASVRNATKGLVRGALALLAGKQADDDLKTRIPNAASLRKAAPDDLVIITFSGHGYAGESGDFFLLPDDVREDGRGGLPEWSSCISSEELSLWLRDLDAGELVMVIDACHAAALAGREFKPGPMGSRGLGQLAYDKGMRVLAATQADKAAIEFGGEFRQGLLSYALTSEGLDRGKANFRPADDRRITIREWLQYGVERVPRLYAEVIGGDLKVTAKDVIVDEGRRADGGYLQLPSLFDFAKKRPDVTLVKLD